MKNKSIDLTEILPKAPADKIPADITYDTSDDVAKISNIDIHVGHRLKVQRLFKGMSQEVLASAVGVTFQQIQKYEKGINRIAASRLFQLGTVLSVPVSYFFEQLQGLSEESINAPVKTMITPPATEETELWCLIEEYSKIKDPHLRKKLVSLAKLFADTPQDID